MNAALYFCYLYTPSCGEPLPLQHPNPEASLCGVCKRFDSEGTELVATMLEGNVGMHLQEMQAHAVKRGRGDETGTNERQWSVVINDEAEWRRWRRKWRSPGHSDLESFWSVGFFCFRNLVGSTDGRDGVVKTQNRARLGRKSGPSCDDDIQAVVYGL
jgi:hypothetical protein